jgi:hypothetical protein
MKNRKGFTAKMQKKEKSEFITVLEIDHYTNKKGAMATHKKYIKIKRIDLKE